MEEHPVLGLVHGCDQQLGGRLEFDTCSWRVETMPGWSILQPGQRLRINGFLYEYAAEKATNRVTHGRVGLFRRMILRHDKCC